MKKWIEWMHSKNIYPPTWSYWYHFRYRVKHSASNTNWTGTGSVKKLQCKFLISLCRMNSFTLMIRKWNSKSFDKILRLFLFYICFSILTKCGKCTLHLSSDANDCLIEKYKQFFTHSWFLERRKENNIECLAFQWNNKKNEKNVGTAALYELCRHCMRFITPAFLYVFLLFDAFSKFKIYGNRYVRCDNNNVVFQLFIEKLQSIKSGFFSNLSF